MDQTPTSIPETTAPETPPATPAKAGEPSDGKPEAKAGEPGKSLLNEKGPPEGAPENYADFKVPQGFELDKDVAAEASAVFKKHNLTQAGAQELVDLYAKLTKEAFEAPFNTYMDKRQEWRNEINSDPEIGGTRLNGVKVSIGRLIDSFGDSKIAEGFREAMDYTGAGDNPAVIRGLYALSKHLTEGTAVRGGGPSVEGQRAPGEGRPSAAQAMYPNLPSNQRG